MLLGKVKHYDINNGWGFIETLEGDDYFFNVANLRAGQKISLRDSVKFDVVQTQKGPSAYNIFRINP